MSELDLLARPDDDTPGSPRIPSSFCPPLIRTHYTKDAQLPAARPAAGSAAFITPEGTRALGGLGLRGRLLMTKPSMGSLAPARTTLGRTCLSCRWRARESGPKGSFDICARCDGARAGEGLG